MTDQESAYKPDSSKESLITLNMVTVLIWGDATHTLLSSQGQIIMLALYVRITFS